MKLYEANLNPYTLNPITYNHEATSKTFASDARLAFLFEKHSKAYTSYDDASIAEEKVNIAQKVLQRVQLCWTAGRAGA
jgi:hypothetical protein